MIDQYEIVIPKKERGFHLITDEVLKHLGDLPRKGFVHLFIQHTSAAITINENADPTVRLDFAASFDHLVRENEPFYRHTFEGPDDMPAHIKSSLLGADLTIPITNHKLNVGTWQGIYLCEFRNHATSRRIIATIYS